MTKVLMEAVGDVGVIRLNDPTTLNAVTLEMLEQLSAAIDFCAERSRVIILTTSGRAFCSGANLSSDFNSGAGGDLDAGRLLESHVNPLIEKMTSLPVPVIAAVRGPAAGVGASLALVADLIVASDTAYFLQAFSRIGLVPDGGASWLLSRAVGRPRAMELMLLGDKLPAMQALDWGLINRVVPDGELDEAALGLANKLAQGPTAAYGLIRQLAWKAADSDLSEMLIAERQAQCEAGKTSDAAEGIAAFIGKRPAAFTGR